MERLNKCETCKYCTGETVLICRHEESDNNTDFVDKEMTCECYENTIMIKKDYSGCTHPNCTECKCKDCIIDHKREFKDLEEFRREQCNIQSAHTQNVNNVDITTA